MPNCLCCMPSWQKTFLPFFTQKSCCGLNGSPASAAWTSTFTNSSHSRCLLYLKVSVRQALDTSVSRFRQKLLIGSAPRRCRLTQAPLLTWRSETSLAIYLTFQDPEKIADGVRLFSPIELWNEVALKLGATPATKIAKAKSLKKELSLVVRRRNNIAHEGDLQPLPPREPWPISQSDLKFVADLIEKVVRGIDAVV